MKLSRSIFYRDYNGQTFVFDTFNHTTFKFKKSVYEFFELFKNDITEKESKEILKNKYPHIDKRTICDDVDKFIMFLKRNNMLYAKCASNIHIKESPNTRYMQRYTIRNKMLYSALFELTYRCPEKCVHCYLEPEKCAQGYNEKIDEELTTEEIKSALKQFADLNAMCVTFSGGEPFMRADIFEILEYARNRQFVIDIFSNGILLDDDRIKRLVDLNINCFHSSIYSHIPEKHDAITGVNGSFKKTWHTLKTLSENNIYVNLKFVLMENNKTDFRKVVELAKSIGATVQLISCVNPSKKGNCEIADYSVKEFADLKETIEYWNTISDFKSFQGDYSDEDPICEAGRNSLTINPYGIITPCNAFSYELGNIRLDLLKNIWENSEKLNRWQNARKKDLKLCSDCVYKSYCSFCPGNALQINGDAFEKYDEACRQAKAQFEVFEKI